MSNEFNYGAPQMQSVSASAIDERVTFIRRTYAHLSGAVALFVALTSALIMSGFGEWFTYTIFSFGGFAWLAVLLVFSGIGWVAEWWAHSQSSKTMQYLGLGLYVFAEAIIFQPILFMAVSFSDPAVLPVSAILTLTVFAGLTVAVFVTKTDFSFLRTALVAGGFLAMGVIVVAIMFGLSLGVWFSVAMIGLASIAILFYTSRVLRDYHTDQYVAASLQLFASLALLFFYVLRLVMALSSD